MSIDKPITEASVDRTLSLPELTAVLVKHYGIHEGHYDLLIEFQIGTGPVGPDPEHQIPGAMVGLSKVGLRPSVAIGPTTFDAGQFNPKISAAKPARKAKAPIKK